MRSKYIEQQLKEIDETPAYHIKGRKELFTKQLLEWGFHDGHTFDLCDHLAKLILPRLKRYKELASTVIKIDFPLDDMINAFDIIAHKEYLSWTNEEKKIVEKGLRAFADYYMCLWW